MTHLRRENTPRVWREVPSESFSATLFGENTRIMSWCKTCREHKPKSEFYLRNKTRRRLPNDVRSDCILCYDTKVEANRLKNVLESSTKQLDKIFIDEESDNYGTLFVGREVSSSDDR